MASKYAPAANNHGELSLSRKDLPKCYVEGKPCRQFGRERAFKNIKEFLTAFEELIHSADQDPVTVWKKYLALNISDDQKTWMRKDVLTCDTWEVAKDVMKEKYGNRQLRLLATQELISIKMKVGETVSDFDTRFTRALDKSDFDVNLQFITDLYFLALPVKWQPNILTLVSAKQKGKNRWTAEDVLKAAITLFDNKIPSAGVIATIATTEVGINKRNNQLDQGDARMTKRRSSTAKFYCKIHGDNNSHESSQCNQNKSGEASLFAGSFRPSRRMLGDRNQPCAATSNPCRYCEK